MAIDRNVASIAAEQANRLFGKWMPEHWLNLFIDSYDDIEACRAVPDETAKPSGDWFPYPVKESDK